MGFDDNVDTDGDGTPDGCDNCNTPGATCDDGDACTINDTLDADCNCAGTFTDADNDGVCDADDICEGVDDSLIGTACDDGDACTSGETYDVNCGCSGGLFLDNDGDGICDTLDVCPNDPNNACNQAVACVSTATSTTYEHISSVTIGAFTNLSGSDGGYGNYLAMNVDATPGENLAIELVPEFSGQSYTEFWAIWVDINNDGNFDAQELLFTASGASAVTGILTVPSAAPGSYNMRISMQYNNAPTPCSTFTYGEVEDYTMKIINSAGCTAGSPCDCLLYTSPSPRDATLSRMPSSA